MGHHEETSNNFVKGALIGGVIGSAAGLLLAPKSGKELREDISDAYCDISEKTHDAAEQIKNTGAHLFGRAENKAEEFTMQPPTSSFVVGSVVGALAGATAAVLLAPKSGAELREDISDKYSEMRGKAEEFASDVSQKGHEAYEKMDDWKDTISEIAHKLSNRAVKKGKSSIEDIADWAMLGLRFWQQINRR